MPQTDQRESASTAIAVTESTHDRLTALKMHGIRYSDLVDALEAHCSECPHYDHDEVVKNR